MSLSRQQKRQIERKARAYIDAMDRDLIERIKAEKRGYMKIAERLFFTGLADDVYEHVSQRGLIS